MEQNIKMSDELKKAREYAENLRFYIPEGQRPSFHLSAPTGWINDPNGFSEYKGKYHLFYQYHPYAANWGPMYWGHSRTSDFISWEQLPAALAPDEEYDGQGCFSGSAVEKDGRHILMYTSVLEKELPDGTREIRQTQSIAIGDGENYEKLDCNPVITADLLPAGSSQVDFRDPKIWLHGDRFYAVIGSRHQDTSGQLVIFSSDNLKSWRFESILDQCRKEYGLMWECPDFFQLDEKGVILTSPQDMEAKGLTFHNGNGTMYLTGSYNEDTLRFTREQVGAIDFGFDFYAPQTLETKDGRRIMIAWMQSWDAHIMQPGFKWSGMMTIPRELHIRNGHLYQNPVSEIRNYYHNPVLLENIHISGETGIEGINGRQLDLTLKLQLEEGSEFSVKLAVDDRHYTEISYQRNQNLMTIDRTYSGLKRDYVSKRDFHAYHQEGSLTLRLLLDKYSVEVFVNEGEQAATMLIITPPEAKGILFSATKETVMQIEKYDVKKEC